MITFGPTFTDSFSEILENIKSSNEFIELSNSLNKNYMNKENIEILMPGVKKENIKIKYYNGKIDVEWKNRLNQTLKTYYKVGNIDGSLIKSKLEDGILTITTGNKKEELKTYEIKVE